MKAILILISVFTISLSSHAQVEKILDKTVIKYLTPDKIPNPGRTDIRYAAYYNPSTKMFHHDGNGLDFSNAHTAPVIALVDRDGVPYYAKLSGSGFYVSYYNDRFEIDKSTYTTKLSFKGWDNGIHDLSIDEMPIWGGGMSKSESKKKKERIVVKKSDKSCSYFKSGSYDPQLGIKSTNQAATKQRELAIQFCRGKGGLNESKTEFKAGTTYKQHGKVWIDWSARVSCNCKN